MSQRAVLRFDSVSKSFGGLQAINQLSFEVRKGEILGLIGPNGAGKTTVFNLIMGVYKPNRGLIEFNGKNITGWKTYKIVNSGVARTFQIPRPFHHKTIVKNVDIALIPNEIFGKITSKIERAGKIGNLCSRVGICKIFGCEKCPLPETKICLCSATWISATI